MQYFDGIFADAKYMSLEILHWHILIYGCIIRCGAMQLMYFLFIEIVRMHDSI